MKYLILTIAILTSYLGYSQVAIGKSTADSQCILDFLSDGNKGIILPYVNKGETDMLNSSVNGTFYFDANTNKVKVIENDVILDLSVRGMNDQSKKFDVTNDAYTRFNESSDVETQGSVIGEAETNARGVLVLDSTEMALAMPVTSNYKNIGSPANGLIVYDNTINKLCVYDGEKWAFWGR